jgi:hypothetical protein
MLEKGLNLILLLFLLQIPLLPPLLLLLDQEYLMYKEGGNKVMFVPQSCCDVNRSNNNEFQMSGGRSIADAIGDVRNSEEYKKAKAEGKEVEMHIPLSITRTNYGIARAHWITAIVKEEQGEHSNIELNYVDSMGLSLAYNFDHITQEVRDISTKEDQANVLIPKVNTDYEYKSDQALTDKHSCGLYVVKYISEYAEKQYSPSKRAVGVNQKIGLFSPDSTFIRKQVAKNHH